MSILYYLILIIFVGFVGLLPMILSIPINGLVIWGQILEDINFLKGNGLYTWLLLSSMVFLAFLVKRKLKKESNNYKYINLIKMLIPWIIFLIYLLINYLLLSKNTVYDSYGLMKLTLFIVKGLIPGFLISIWMLLNKNNKDQNIEKAIFSYGVFQSLVAIQTWFMGSYVGRMTVFGLNPIWVSRNIGLSVIASLDIIKKTFIKYFFIIFLVLCMMLTGSRGPFIALLIVGFLFYTNLGLKNKKYQKILPSIIILVIIILILFGHIVLDDFFNRGRANIFEEGNVQARIMLYKYAWNCFIDNPMLGKGLGSYYLSGDLYPHNIFLELIAETGIIGILLFIVALNPKGIIFFKNRFSKYLLFAFLTSLFSGDLEKNTYLIVFSILSTLETVLLKNES